MPLTLDTTACTNLAIPARVMRHVVEVESGANPFAIGVVRGQLVRQPRNLDEAVATARMLEAQGYDYSLGAAQINRANLLKQGLDTLEKAFDVCANLAAGSRILSQCHASAGGNWGKAFSCYYAGDFETGFRHGYVRKVYDSISRGVPVAPRHAPVEPIPLKRPTSAARVAARPAPLRDAPPAPAAPASRGDSEAPARQSSSDAAFVF